MLLPVRGRAEHRKLPSPRAALTMGVRRSSQKKKREERGVDVWAKLSRKQTTYPTLIVALKVRCAEVDCQVSELKSSLSSTMRPLHDIPSFSSFQLKEKHSGYLCKVHATRLARQPEPAPPSGTCQRRKSRRSHVAFRELCCKETRRKGTREN